MTLLKWIIVAIFICGISGEPVPKTFGKENSEESPRNENVPVSKSWNRTRLNLNSYDKTKRNPVPLLFSDHRGTRVVLSEDRRTVSRLAIPNMDDVGNSLAYTSRPLMDYELFEITLEELHGGPYGYFLIFGVVGVNPERIPQLPFLPFLIMVPGWYLSGTFGYQCTESCGESGINLPRSGKVGDTLGVMKTSSGYIQFYFNKELIGSLKDSYNTNVYGVADLQNNGRVSISS